MLDRNGRRRGRRAWSGLQRASWIQWLTLTTRSERQPDTATALRKFHTQQLVQQPLAFSAWERERGQETRRPSGWTSLAESRDGWNGRLTASARLAENPHSPRSTRPRHRHHDRRRRCA